MAYTDSDPLLTMEVVQQARANYTQSESYHAALLAKYRRWHHWYAPQGGDQWPEDAQSRPGKVHITSNVIKPFVDVGARLEAKLPRITLRSQIPTPEERERAEFAEQLVKGWLDDSDWELWMQRLTRVKRIYGKAVLKPFWNKEERRPDVRLIEQPYNLRIGWATNDFSKKDWALYEYTVSADEARRLWPEIDVHDPNPLDKASPLEVRIADQLSTQEDPLAQRQSKVHTRTPSDYEQKHITVWDYWCLKGDGKVYNTVILQKKVAVKPSTHHKEYVEVPYIVIENDHEPGSPEGMSSVEPMIDDQYELNRVRSLIVQLLVDNLDPAWQLDDDTVPDGIVPRGGEIVAAGEGRQIRSIDKPVNNFPAEQAVAGTWNQLHRITGEGEILFGAPASAQDSGRALAVQVESVINRMEPNRLEMFSGLKSLIAFWVVMATKLKPKFGEFRPHEILAGQTRWQIVAPEITPKDAADHTNTVLNQLNGMVIDLEEAMDRLGVDSPAEMKKRISEDRSTLSLFPGHAQAMAQVGLLLLQLEQQGITLDQIMAGGGGGASGTDPNSQAGANNAAAQQRGMMPTRSEDQNQPATAPGGLPPLQATSLVRSTADQESQSLNQLAFQAPVTG
jgi:hypothetical protein